MTDFQISSELFDPEHHLIPWIFFPFFPPTDFCFSSFLSRMIFSVPFSGFLSLLWPVRLRLHWGGTSEWLSFSFHAHPFILPALYPTYGLMSHKSAILSPCLTFEIQIIYPNFYSTFSTLPCLKLNPSYTKPAPLHALSHLSNWLTFFQLHELPELKP